MSLAARIVLGVVIVLLIPADAGAAEPDDLFREQVADL